eukprot:CAMPEP_0119355744 /NCGR_PEP_ID=MMETSP1334-20130426/4540_1 /TAXON_ID=127549 /ORGANISM="Calcidiscus leptoporus, Strain RCC1130" /LENGTH=62 /DNA_ID=CAMNT_0007369649 /DNA_START=1 /DNA_END=185 /DNA_ORIENTATION=+
MAIDSSSGTRNACQVGGAISMAMPSVKCQVQAEAGYVADVVGAAGDSRYLVHTRAFEVGSQP